MQRCVPQQQLFTNDYQKYINMSKTPNVRIYKKVKRCAAAMIESL